MASVFEEANSQNDNSGTQQSASFLDQLVGPGKKYKDADELAKAYLNADEHISRMKEDNTHLRTEFETFREVVTKDLAKNSTSNNGNNNSNDPNGSNEAEAGRREPAAEAPSKTGGNEEVDIDARIAQIMETRDEQKRLQQNADFAQEILINHFGDRAAAVEAVQQKAAELEVSPQWLADAAFKSPKAFLSTMGITDTKPRSSSTPRSASDVNVQNLNKTNSGPAQGTYAFYENIRRTNPSKYWTAATQSAMMADAAKKGDDF